MTSKPKKATAHKVTPGPYELDDHTIYSIPGDVAIADVRGNNSGDGLFILKAMADHKALDNSVRLAVDFLASLPPGWLAKTTGDIGLLNDFYCTLLPEYRPKPKGA